MKQETLKKAISLGQQLKHVFVATADPSGIPHVAAAGKISLAPEGRVAVAAWFCPGTVANLGLNRKATLVIWDPGRDYGFQLLGETEKVEEIAMMNGYLPQKEGAPSLPQVERQLTLRIHKILDFKHAPHSDQEE